MADLSHYRASSLAIGDIHFYGKNVMNKKYICYIIYVVANNVHGCVDLLHHHDSQLSLHIIILMQHARQKINYKS